MGSCTGDSINLLHLPSLARGERTEVQITAKAGNYIVPRILNVIASNYVSEFHSKLKAFMIE